MEPRRTFLPPGHWVYSIPDPKPEIDKEEERRNQENLWAYEDHQISKDLGESLFES